MQKAKIYISFLFFALTTLAQAQDYEIEKLKETISSQPEDSTKVNSLIVLSSKYLGEAPREATKYAMESLELAKKLNILKWKAYAYKAVGLSYFYQANYPEAAIQFQSSLAIFDSVNYQAGQANILNSLGSTYFNVGDNTKAIDYHLRSLTIAEKLKDSIYMGTALNGIGTVYNNNPATVDKALEYYLKALPIFNGIHYEAGSGIIAMNIGEIYKKKKRYDSAIIYFDESIEVYRGTIDATFPLNMLGSVYAELGNFNEALMYQNKALEIAKAVNAKFEISQSLLGIGQTLRKQGKAKESIQYFRDAVLFSKEIDAKEHLKDAYGGLAKSYATVGDFKNAYTYDTLFRSVKDTLYNTDNDKKLQQLQFNFDIGKKETEIDLLTADQALKAATIQRQKILNYAAVITGGLLILVIAGFYNRYRYVRKTNKIIKDERDRSQELLLNILPEEIARELETSGYAKAQFYDNVTVLFTDFKGFSSIAGKLTPQDLVAELNEYFIAFDEIVGRFNLEKIKTIGDAYMCAGGIPTVNQTHPLDAVKAGLAMQEFMITRNEERKSKGLPGSWELRIGIHTGPIVAGVVGKKKYAYDIWGDAVNIASRMESNGEPGKVNISASTYYQISDHYQCLHRGKISAKNIGEVDMYFVESEIEMPAQQAV